VLICPSLKATSLAPRKTMFRDLTRIFTFSAAVTNTPELYPVGSGQLRRQDILHLYRRELVKFGIDTDGQLRELEESLGQSLVKTAAMIESLAYIGPRRNAFQVRKKHVTVSAERPPPPTVKKQHFNKEAIAKVRKMLLYGNSGNSSLNPTTQGRVQLKSFDQSILHAISVNQTRMKQVLLNGTFNININFDNTPFVTVQSVKISPSRESPFRLMTDQSFRMRLLIFPPPPNNTLHKDRFAILARPDEPAARVGIEFI